MRYVAQWSEIQRYAPGSYKQALLSEFFFSLAERKQASALAQSIKLHPSQPRLGEAWFPTVQDTPLPFGILIKIQILSEHLTTIHERNQLETKAIEHWMLLNLGASPIPFPTLSISDLPPGWKLEGKFWHLAGLCAVISKIPSATRSPSYCLWHHTHSFKSKPHFSSVQHINKKQQLCRWEFPDIAPFLLSEDDGCDNFNEQIETWLSSLLVLLGSKSPFGNEAQQAAIAEAAYHQYRYGEKEQGRTIGVDYGQRAFL